MSPAVDQDTDYSAVLPALHLFPSQRRNVLLLTYLNQLEKDAKNMTMERMSESWRVSHLVPRVLKEIHSSTGW